MTAPWRQVQGVAGSALGSLRAPVDLQSRIGFSGRAMHGGSRPARCVDGILVSKLGCCWIPQYTHGVAARVAHFLHRPAPPLHDMGFAALPVRSLLPSSSYLELEL